MEDDNQQIDPLYVRRFNDGYVLAKYMPELSEQIFSKEQSDSAGFRAMQDGRKQFLNEQAIEKAPFWLKKDSQKSNKTSAGKSKGKNAGHQIDPDR